MMTENPMMGVAVAAMRWHHARLHRLEIGRAYKQSVDADRYGRGVSLLSTQLAEARRLESRYKWRLTKACGLASDKPKRNEVIDI